MNKLYWKIGAISGALSVALGAFGGRNLLITTTIHTVLSSWIEKESNKS